MTSIGKENRSSQCLSYLKKKTVREREKKKKEREKKKGESILKSSQKDWIETMRRERERDFKLS